jgi:hypothetical protein
MCMYVCTYVFIYVCTYVCIYVCICVYVRMCVCVCVCVWMCVCQPRAAAVITFCQSYTFTHNPSLDASSLSARPEVPSFYWNRMFITVFTTARRHWFPYWNTQLNLILNIHFNIISLLRLNSGLSPSGSPSEAFYINSCHISRPSHPPAFDQPHTTSQYTAVNSTTAAYSNYAALCRLLFQPPTYVTSPHNPLSWSVCLPQFLHFLITTHPHVSLSIQTNKSNGQGMKHVWGRAEVHTGFSWENLRERDHMEDPRVNGIIGL